MCVVDETELSVEVVVEIASAFHDDSGDGGGDIDGEVGFGDMEMRGRGKRICDGFVESGDQGEEVADERDEEELSEWAEVLAVRMVEGSDVAV
eukprot:CAMPEP_0197061048 /NCGR_PEP_ID=MMETSP1384-20130603/133052_1 /TAXON_ID=29189 /ORGANISM="Ammonia sp." /LENGTH=92 /DNA_ID=CAMNT_0042496567 /DNA_START=174 /DNA_END=449 /DNA_ORIENTATION=+